MTQRNWIYLLETSDGENYNASQPTQMAADEFRAWYRDVGGELVTLTCDDPEMNDVIDITDWAWSAIRREV